MVKALSLQDIKKSKNWKMLGSFMNYCLKNPDQRFWQALRNWSGYGFIFVSNYSRLDGDKQFLLNLRDTFYWDKNKERHEL